MLMKEFLYKSVEKPKIVDKKGRELPSLENRTSFSREAIEGGC